MIDITRMFKARKRKKRFFYIAFFVMISVVACSTIDDSDLVPPTVMQDSSLPSLKINGTKLHLETYGDPTNPVIIALHGGPGSDAKALHSLVETYNAYNLTDNYYLVLWDQRGAGLSQRHNDDSVLSMAVYLQDLEALVDNFAPGREVILLGHSFGGVYAAMYMDKHPDRIAGAILLEPGEFSTDLSKQKPETSDNIFDEWISDLLWARQFIDMNNHEKADYIMTIPLIANNPSQPYPLNRFGAAVFNFLLGELLGDGVNIDYTTNLNLVTPEVLFIVGGADSNLGLGKEFQDIQRQKFTSSRIEVVPNAAHDDIIWSKASKSVPIMRSYLESLDLSGAIAP